MFLTDEQIKALTKRQRAKAQARVLTYLGIPYRLRPDGSLVVAVEDAVAGATPSKTRSIEPNWGALHAKATKA